MTDLPGFNPTNILKTLARHQVRFVLIGGLAGRTHGSNTITGDVDICCSREGDNLQRLAEALNELGARLPNAPADVPLILDAESLEAGDHFSFSTAEGDLDILGTPSGVPSFEKGLRLSIIWKPRPLRPISTARRSKSRH